MSASSTARASDVVTLDAIVRALYECISGPSGQKRDWERYRSLLAPECRFVIAVIGEQPRLRVLDADQYIARVDPIFDVEDFWEVETRRSTEQIGNIAHVLSHYESKRTADGPAFESGANSMQLFFDGTRWWFVSVYWNTRRSG